MRLSTFATLALFLAVVTPAAAEVILVNAFEIPRGQRDAAVAAWAEARDFLAEEPGYISATLHEAMSPNARFALVNVARWESAEAFMAATLAMSKAGVFVPPEDVVANAALYTIVSAD